MNTTLFNVREVIPFIFKMTGVQFGGHSKQMPTMQEYLALNPPSVTQALK
ncbi:MAG TPA: hypothetical protein VE344_07760 [Methylomirabilota bacterium]|nr:hypothetical protein [Methylomirabilota bacterium]